MWTREEYIHQLFSLNTQPKRFTELAMHAFQFQLANNPVYNSFCSSLNISLSSTVNEASIPFMPAAAFGVHKIVSFQGNAPLVFKSSGTSGSMRSSHYIIDPDWYNKVLLEGFSQFYGAPASYAILALLPSYLEQGESSLVYMVNRLMESSGHEENSFFMHNHEALNQSLMRLKTNGQKTILFGVSYALLDFAEAFHPDFPELIVIETGGMKGRRKEMIRQELHERLNKEFSTPSIHSEYGMTELLSQAYSKGNGLYESVPWMKILIRDMHDPMQILEPGNSGLIQIIDLANIDSCCFIATDDIGRVHENGTFEVLGRADQSMVRGCNLLATE